MLFRRHCIRRRGLLSIEPEQRGGSRVHRASWETLQEKPRFAFTLHNQQREPIKSENEMICDRVGWRISAAR
jgi:hypothetical protein